MIKADNYREMICPVCGDFYFSKLDEEEAEILDFVQCSKCGWKCDAQQTDNPDLRYGENEMSLNEYKKWFEKELEENPEYDYSEANYSPSPHVCPICGKYEFSDEGSFDACPFCGWIDDTLMEAEPEKWAGCANDLCLNDYKKRYESFVAAKPDYQWKKDNLL